MSAEPIIIERILNAPVEKVWQAITDNSQMKKWYFDIREFKPEPGFEFEFTAVGKDGVTKFTHICKITVMVTNKLLTYSWRYLGYEGMSFVTFELFGEDGKTRVKLTHEGVETFPKTDDFLRQNFVDGWAYIVGKALKEFVE